jgi:hypothetical protein
MILHVTDLDSYQWYKRIESMTKDEMVKRLNRTSEPNERMQIGTAWHDILENPPDSIDEIERGGYKFKVDCDKTITLPQIREIRATKTYTIGEQKVTLTGKCDGITGLLVDDHKLTFKPNLETYFDSYQWRAYLDIFSADIFEYLIYPARQKNKEITIKDVVKLRMYRYPGMHDDVVSGIRELVQFINEHVK